jgi:protein involved in polysaccharide export with SLBB domain
MPTENVSPGLRAVVYALLLGAAWATPLPAQSVEAREPMLRPGDAVRITVFRQPELTGEFEVASDSTVGHPLYRQVRVAGVPTSMAEDRLRLFLEELEATPNFVVQPLFRVAVGGEVRQPNLYSLSPSTTLAQAVAAAGGLSDRGRLDRVRLLREGREHRVDLTRPGSGLADAPVRSGDQIVVERRVDFFREYVAPAGSITAALVSLISVLTR